MVVQVKNAKEHKVFVGEDYEDYFDANFCQLNLGCVRIASPIGPKWKDRAILLLHLRL